MSDKSLAERVGYTPEDWVLYSEGDTIAILKNGNQREPIIEWDGFDSSNFPLPEKKANGILIAAAPQMIEALVAAGKQFRKYALGLTIMGKHDKAMTDYKMSDICIDAVTAATGMTWEELNS